MELTFSTQTTMRQLRRAASHAPMLDAETERTLLAEASTGSEEALRRVVLSHLRLVLSIASRYAGRGVPPADLIGEGVLGLVEAARRFDPGRGTRFGTYAAFWVRAFVRRHALDNRRLVPTPSTRNGRRILWGMRTIQREIEQRHGRPARRDEVAAALHVRDDEVAMVESALAGWDISLGPRDDGSAFDLAGEGPSPEQQAADDEVRALESKRVARALCVLTPREREIIRSRLLSEDTSSLASLGARFGVSRERVRRIQKQAERKLRSVLVQPVA